MIFVLLISSVDVPIQALTLSSLFTPLLSLPPRTTPSTSHMRGLGGSITAGTRALSGDVAGLTTLVAGSPLLMSALSGDVTFLSTVLP